MCARKNSLSFKCRLAFLCSLIEVGIFTFAVCQIKLQYECEMWNPKPKTKSNFQMCLKASFENIKSLIVSILIILGLRGAL